MSTSTTTTANRFASTPGEILKEEFLEPLGVSNYRLAKAIGVSESAVGDLVHGRRGISTIMAFRLAKAFNTTPEFWMNLQRDYDALTVDTSSLANITPLVTA